MRCKILAVATGLLLLVLSSTAFSWDGNVVGVVDYVEVWGDGHVSIQLRNGPVLCSAGTGGSGGNTFGEVVVGNSNVTADGLKAITSILLSANLSGKKVQVVSNAYSNFCRIGVVVLVHQ
jgi:hypothetical protein